MSKIRDKTRREAYTINIFQVPRFKIWLDVKQRMNAVGIGGKSLGPSFLPFKLYADEQVISNIDTIKVGTIKVLPVGEINGRIVCALKEDLKPYLESFKITTKTNLFVPRSEFNYLFFLYLIQKEGLGNVITRYRQENSRGNSGSFFGWNALGVNQVEGKVTITWDSPNCLKSASSRIFLEDEKYPLISEWKDPKFRDIVS
jgi:hypothetical protein